MLESIFVNEINKINNIKLIDIRSVEKYNNNHIYGAINIPVEKLLANFDKYLNKKEKYYIYCQKGIQSKKICRILKNNGYDVVDIIGGYEEWLLNK